MEIYNLRRGDLFKITSELCFVPPGEPEPDRSKIYAHDKIDGMYSINYDADKNVVYLAAWTLVEVIE
jgi:hypothetical protein